MAKLIAKLQDRNDSSQSKTRKYDQHLVAEQGKVADMRHQQIAYRESVSCQLLVLELVVAVQFIC